MAEEEKIGRLKFTSVYPSSVSGRKILLPHYWRLSKDLCFYAMKNEHAYPFGFRVFNRNFLHLLEPNNSSGKIFEELEDKIKQANKEVLKFNMLWFFPSYQLEYTTTQPTSLLDLISNLDINALFYSNLEKIHIENDRFSLNKPLAEYLNLDKKVYFIGIGDVVLLMNPKTYEEFSKLEDSLFESVYNLE